MSDIKIIVKETEQYWYCIPKEYNNCPIEPEQYNSEMDLEEILRSNYTIVGQCSNSIIVTDSFGSENTVYPKKILKTS